MKLTVEFAETTPERWNEAISLLARAYGNFLKRDRSKGEGPPLPAGSKKPSEQDVAGNQEKA